MADSDLVVDNIIYEIGKRIYPVGSIYISLNSTDPGTLFGGSWVRVYDTVLRAVSSSETPATSPTSSGVATYVGSNSVSLTESNIPQYDIGFLPAVVMTDHSAWANGGVKYGYKSKSNYPASATHTLKGNGNDGDLTPNYQWGWNLKSKGSSSSTGVNILPKHLDVYMWRRYA